MKKTTFLFLLAAVLFLSACSDHYYAPILYNNSMSYQAKPMSTDSSKSANYISGGLNIAPGVNLSDNIYMGQLNLDRANTFKNFNIAYGIFGFAGVYSNTSLVKTDVGYFDTQSFAGIGAKLSGNFFIPVNDRVDFRLIGFELSYSNEFGDYANFRNTIKNQNGYYTDNVNNVFSGGLTTEVAWRGVHNTNMQYAVRGYIGTTFGSHSLENSSPYPSDLSLEKTNIGASFYMQVDKKYSIIVEKQNVVNTTLRFGILF